MLPHDVDGKLRVLTQACWNSDPSFRPTAMKACRVLDGLRSFNTHYSGVLHLAMNPKKILEQQKGHNSPDDAFLLPRWPNWL